MENLAIRLDEKNWKSLMVAQGYVNISSKGHDSPGTFFSSLEKKGLLESLKRIPISGITQVSLLQGDDTVHFEWYDEKGKVQKFSAEFDSEQDAERVVHHLSTTRGMTRHERSAGLWKSIGNGVVGLLVSLALTAVTYVAAKEIEAGGDMHVSGRRAWLKVIIWGIAETLGPAGSLILGLLISAGFGWYVWKRLKQPATEVVWS